MLDDLDAYRGANGNVHFRFYLDAVRSILDSERESYLLDVQRLDLRIRALADTENPDSDFVERLFREVRAIREEPPGIGMRVIREQREDWPRLFGDLLTIATPPMSYTDGHAILVALAAWVNARLGFELVTPTILSPRYPPSAVFTLDAKIRASGRTRAEAEQMAAANRIADWLGSVVYRARRRWVYPVLRDLARQHGHAFDAELRSRIVAGLFEVVECAGAYTFAEDEAVRAALRAQLNKLLTPDVLGPGWRKMHKTEPIDGHGPSDVSPESAITARLEVDRLKARLTPREAEVIKQVMLYGAEHGALDAAAQDLGISPETARKRWERVQKKLRAVGE